MRTTKNKEIKEEIKNLTEQNLNILRLLLRTPIEENFLKQKARENFERIENLENL